MSQSERAKGRGRSILLDKMCARLYLHVRVCFSIAWLLLLLRTSSVGFDAMEEDPPIPVLRTDSAAKKGDVAIRKVAPLSTG